MRVGIIGNANGWHTRSLQEALRRRGVEAPCFPVTRLAGRLAGAPRVSSGGESLDGYDVLFVRSIPAGSLEQVIFRMDTLHRLENRGVRVANPPLCIEQGVDKYYTATLLEDAGVPTPRTVVAERFDEALAAYEELGGDVVVKPLFGSEGRGMTRVTDPDVAYRTLRALELGRYVFCLQEFVPPGGRDIRTFVLGNRVLCAMGRTGAGWKANVAQGGTPRSETVNGRIRELSVRAAAALGATYAGVDLLALEGGDYTVLEVNTIPGWRALERVTGTDVAGAVVAHTLGGG